LAEAVKLEFGLLIKAMLLCFLGSGERDYSKTLIVMRFLFPSIL
jgi:hypothetical protein